MIAEVASNISTIATCITLAILGAGQITIWITLKSPQRREISFTGNPVDQKDFDRHLSDNKTAHDQIFSKIGGAERGVEARLNDRFSRIEHNLADNANKNENRAKAIHERIDAILSAVSELRGRFDATNK